MVLSMSLLCLSHVLPEKRKNENWTLGRSPAQKLPQWSTRTCVEDQLIKAELGLDKNWGGGGGGGMPLWQLPGVDYKRFLNLPIESPGWGP